MNDSIYYNTQLVCGLTGARISKVDGHAVVTIVIPNGHYTDMRGARMLACQLAPECRRVNVEWDDGSLVNVYVGDGEVWECIFRDH